MESLLLLPNPSNLSPNLLQFLDQHFKTHEDLSLIPSLLKKLKKDCGDSDWSLLSLKKNLSSTIASWISRSDAVDSVLHQLSLKLEDFDPAPFRGTKENAHLKRIQRILDEELPMIVKEVRWIEMVRAYAETTLQLEALVGDLEDTVFSVMNQRSRNIFSFSLPNTSNPTDIKWKQEKLLLAINAMREIEELLVKVVKSRPKWSCLLNAVDSRVDKTMAILRPQALADHRSLLSSLGWPPPLLASGPDKENNMNMDFPNPLCLMQGDKKDQYSQSFLALCALQHLQCQRESRQHDLAKQKKGHQLSALTVLCSNPCLISGLWTVDELVSPIATRMEYHFSRWLDQPKFIFALVYRIARDFIGLDDVLQPLIDKARLVGCSAKEAWVSAMVKMLSGYLTKQVFSRLAERYYGMNENLEVNSSWLHLVDLIISFDKRMQELAGSGTPFFIGETVEINGISRGTSVLAIFCDQLDWLVIWAAIELKDAEEKLDLEVQNNQVWRVDMKQEREFIHGREDESFLFSSREDYKAPSIVDSVLRITWAMIERCHTLPNILLRVQFIKLSAVRFLHEFFDLLLQHCQGIDSAIDQVNDDSLSRTFSLINAACYCESILQEWSESIEFLEMVIITDNAVGLIEDDRGLRSCFFRDEIKKLMKLEAELLEEILAVLLRKFNALCRYYAENREQWEQENLAANGIYGVEDMTVSTDLIEALDDLRERLHVLKKGLNSKDFLDLWRGVAGGLDYFVFSIIPLSGVRFSTQGINQFRADMQALFFIFRPFCARPQAFFPYISDALILLEMGREDAMHIQEVLLKGERMMECLHAHGVHHVSPPQAGKILRSRRFGV
ncbi:hypothetical protein MRB53_026870 [Persea americana]|uniref:Uncharacterized protein n=1 Tax=Persea americana TaxID=3435 RepID=A0ACC2LJF0_PERAE|nr:hypothetical protein MRB53_026870 [Persea americana]|eukprot:TRINITY_DN38810_c0_g2_i1.p1 TRINITY_DN38810_c0_g2~~TRINITY_DN38810_c0_g2_i1.p1  ORF type:complete len:901 (+),score=172.83 TRINITY_DN38810_c0_g2_i1:175-2703(+)